MLGLARYEAGVCDCGFHESLTSDLSNTFVPDYRICKVCAGGDKYERMWEEEDRKAPGDLPADAPRDSDGRKLSMRLLTPGEAAERARNASTPGRARLARLRRAGTPTP